jgi:hypothetical protein
MRKATDFAPSPRGGGMAKTEKFGWAKIPDAQGTLAYLDKRVIGVDEEYQRELSNLRVIPISRNFSWMAFGVLMVAQREDGSLPPR